MYVLEYVHLWYDDVSKDPAFLCEIRQIYFRAINYVYSRIRYFNLTAFILEDVFPIVLQHGEIYLDMQRKFPHADQQLLESLIIDLISKKARLHRAALNRNAEIQYLRHLAAFVVDSSVPKDARKSAAARKFAVETLAYMILLPLMDILADPDTINFLATILFSDEKFIEYSDADVEPSVKLLENFQNPAAPQSLLQLKLTDILNEPNILYLFMGYLKQTRSPLNYLQFVMAAKQLQDSFASGKDSASLSFECWELYKEYFHEGSQDRIEFPEQMYKEFKTAVDSMAENNSAAIESMKSAIMKSYKFVYDQLSSQYVYRFNQSSAFWQYLIGSRELSPELL